MQYSCSPLYCIYDTRKCLNNTILWYSGKCIWFWPEKYCPIKTTISISYDLLPSPWKPWTQTGSLVFMKDFEIQSVPPRIGMYSPTTRLSSPATSSEAEVIGWWNSVEIEIVSIRCCIHYHFLLHTEECILHSGQPPLWTTSSERIIEIYDQLQMELGLSGDFETHFMMHIFQLNSLAYHTSHSLALTVSNLARSLRVLLEQPAMFVLKSMPPALWLVCMSAIQLFTSFFFQHLSIFHIPKFQRSHPLPGSRRSQSLHQRQWPSAPLMTGSTSPITSCDG